MAGAVGIHGQPGVRRRPRPRRRPAGPARRCSPRAPTRPCGSARSPTACCPPRRGRAGRPTTATRPWRCPWSRRCWCCGPATPPAPAPAAPPRARTPTGCSTSSPTRPHPGSSGTGRPGRWSCGGSARSAPGCPPTGRDFARAWTARYPLAGELGLSPLRRYGTRGASRGIGIPLVLPAGVARGRPAGPAHRARRRRADHAGRIRHTAPGGQRARRARRQPAAAPGDPVPAGAHRRPGPRTRRRADLRPRAVRAQLAAARPAAAAHLRGNPGGPGRTDGS